MKEYLGPNDIANEIRMSRTVHKGSFAIVEGDADSLAYKLFFSKDCQIVIAHGKKNAIDALGILECSDFLGVIAIVDRDFWDHEQMKNLSKNLLITDCHDIETMIIESPALEKVVHEYGSNRKIKDRIGGDFVEFRKTLFSACIYLGLFRWVSIKNNYNLSFKDLSFDKFIDKDNLVCNVKEMIRHIKDKNSRHDLDSIEIEREIIEQTENRYSMQIICCGHDLVKVIGIALKRFLGNCNSGEVDSLLLERSLRLAYEFKHFSATVLYRDLKGWENNNPPYTIIDSDALAA